MFSPIIHVKAKTEFTAVPMKGLLKWQTLFFVIAVVESL